MAQRAGEARGTQSRIFIREAECCTGPNKVGKKGHVATSEPSLRYAIVISIQCLGRIRSTTYKEGTARTRAAFPTYPHISIVCPLERAAHGR